MNEQLYVWVSRWVVVLDLDGNPIKYWYEPMTANGALLTFTESQIKGIKTLGYAPLKTMPADDFDPSEESDQPAWGTFEPQAKVKYIKPDEEVEFNMVKKIAAGVGRTPSAVLCLNHSYKRLVQDFIVKDDDIKLSVDMANYVGPITERVFGAPVIWSDNPSWAVMQPSK